MGMYMHGTHRLIQAGVYSTHIPMSTCTMHTCMPVSEQILVWTHAHYLPTQALSYDPTGLGGAKAHSQYIPELSCPEDLDMTYCSGV